MHEWDTFAVVLGGSAGAPVELLFVALSIHAKRISASAVTASGVALAGVLLACRVPRAHFVLVPAACGAIIGGLAGAFMLLIELTD